MACHGAHDLEQRPASNEVRALVAGADGSLWVGTDGGGLARVAQGKVTQVLTTAQGLPSNVVRAMTVDALSRVFQGSRHVLLLGRSGTGKSVLQGFLAREAARRFTGGEDARVPILLDMRTHPLAGQRLESLIVDAIKGAEVELPDEMLEHMIRKGGFILLVDSLNELPDKAAANAFHPFLNRNAGNFVIIASQADVLQRQDFAAFRIAEVSEQQARQYLHDALGHDPWDQLPAPVRILARNPQDLVLLTDVIRALGAERVPTRRAELYRELLQHDTALASWANSADVKMRAIYGLAFHMIQERRVLAEHA